MSEPQLISQLAMERAFDALEASCRAALTAAAASGERLDPPPPLLPAYDLNHATRRVIHLAYRLKDALVEYGITTQLPDLDPPDDPNDAGPFDDDDLLF